MIELDFPVEYFVSADRAQTAVTPTISAPGAPRLNVPPVQPPTYIDETPVFGGMTPPGRAATDALTAARISEAFNLARQTGYFDQTVFPNIKAGDDSFSRACAIEALAGLDAATVVAQINAGNRLTIYRDTSGRCVYRFVPSPSQGVPTLLLVEYYRLSSFPARYGAGRTIKTFSLLPGERSRIRVNTYKRSTESLQRSASIVDSTSQETESEFERSVLGEQSRQDDTNKSFEYHAEAKAEAKASWGWGSAGLEASGGVAGTSNATRQEFAKNVSNAVSQNAARASSRREVQIDTSLDVKLESGEEQAVERELENINVSRTLNFVFRQMNQEFLTILHLVDVRVAFFNGYTESRAEVPLPEMDRLIATYVVPEQQERVRAAISAELAAIVDYRGQAQPDFVGTKEVNGSPGYSYLQVSPDFVMTHTPAAGGTPVTVPGAILAVDSHVMRTDGVVVDAFLGLGNSLDDYSTGIQAQAVRARQLENDRAELDLQRATLALEIVRSGDPRLAAVYQQMFPNTPIVNQVEQAVISGQNNGQAPVPASASAADGR